MKSRFKVRGAGVVGLVGVSLGATFAGLTACGDNFASNDCRATRTCNAAEAAGTAGQPAASEGGAADSSNGGASAPIAVGGSDAGGEPGSAGAGAAAAGGGGEGGEGGAPVAVVPDCTSDADCSDHLACNGPETCDKAGHCAPGTPPACANADTANCSAACLENAGTYLCVVSANDTDHDGHVSALCASAPGDDCDDAQASVYTGAPELCDRLDNDCDKHVDLDDGLTFTGKSKLVGTDLDSTVRAEDTVAAWSSTSELYAMFWRLRGLTDLVVALYDAKGARKAGPTTVGYSSVGSLAISAGPTGFGLVWNSDSQQSTEFRTINAKGELLTPTALTGRLGPADAPLALAWSNAGQRWEVAAERGTAGVSQAGVGQAFVAKLEATYQVEGLELVAAGSAFVLGVSGRESPSQIVSPRPRVYRYDASATLQPATDKLGFDSVVGASVVHLAVRSDGSFATVAPAVKTETSKVTAFDSMGTRKCAYTDPARVSGLAGTDAGYTLALFGTPAATHFRELSNSCEAGLLVPSKFVYPYSPTLVASPTSYLNLWSDDDGTSFYSFFGSNFCN